MTARIYVRQLKIYLIKRRSLTFLEKYVLTCLLFAKKLIRKSVDLWIPNLHIKLLCEFNITFIIQKICTCITITKILMNQFLTTFVYKNIIERATKIELRSFFRNVLCFERLILPTFAYVLPLKRLMTKFNVNYCLWCCLQSESSYIDPHSASLDINSREIL